MDDIVVKSKARENHFSDLRRVFERCRLYKLRMNPLKCAFGVLAGKFLGFLVHQRRIDVDTSKAQAIATMKPLTRINIYPSLVNKETQKLSSGNTKSTLEGVHTKLVKATSFKDSPQVRKMVFPCF